MGPPYGVAESPAFPTNNRLVSTWFPKQERALATGVYLAGEYVGLGFLTPVLAWILASFGWQQIFIITGIVGLIWAIFWFKFVRDPQHHPRVNAEELNYIKEGDGLGDSIRERHTVKWAQLGDLFRHRQLVGIYIGELAVVATLYFFLTWFPTYLVTAKHITIIKMGFYASIPYIFAFVGSLFGGAWSDWMIRRGVSLSVARKIPIVIGLLLASVIILANYTNSIGAVITIMSIAFFAQGMSNMACVLVSDVAPRNLIGTAGGVFNFSGGVSAVVTPLVIGLIVNATHSFNGALAFIAIVTVIGALSYIFVVGKVRRIEEPEL